MSKAVDLTGQRFGRLTVVRLIGKNHNNKLEWLCKCDCGKEIVAVTGHLKSGHTNSCGCYAQERAKEANITHNGKGTRLYNIWCDIKKRCTNEKFWAYKDYGGRGIKICAAWEHDFECFRKWAEENGYDDSLTIDRIDVNGDYAPDNCRWVNRTVQMNNTRSNHIVTVNGESLTIAQWAERLEITRYRIDSAYKRGADLEEYIGRLIDQRCKHGEQQK